MSNLMLNPDTKSEIKKKKKKSLKKPKSELTYEEAIKQIQGYNTEITEVAKYRISKPVFDDFPIVSHHFAKAGIILGASGVAEIMLAINSGWAIMDGAGLVMGTIASGGVIAFVSAVAKKSLFGFSPVKTRKVQEQHKLDMALYEMKEAEFGEAKKEIFEKAAPAIKLIDETLKFENRHVRFNGVKGKEQLFIAEITNLDSWQQELLKVEKQKLGSDSTPAIAPAEPRKELTS